MRIINPFIFAGGGGGGTFDPIATWGRFDGSNDYVQSSQTGVMPGGEFTISLWLRADQVAAQRYAWFGNGTIAFGVSSGAKIRLIAAYSADKVWQFANTDGATSISASTWYHVVFIQDNSGIYWYIDGSLDGSNTTFTGGSISDPDLNVGARAGNSYFDGSLADVRIYSRVLTSGEIEWLGSGGASGDDPTDTNLHLWYKFDEGSGTTVGDSSASGFDGTATNTDSSFWST